MHPPLFCCTIFRTDNACGHFHCRLHLCPTAPSPDGKEHNMKNCDRKYFIPVNGTPVEVSEEVYRAYYRPVWGTRYHAQKNGECRCSKRQLWLCDGFIHPKRTSPLKRPLQMETKISPSKMLLWAPRLRNQSLWTKNCSTLCITSLTALTPRAGASVSFSCRERPNARSPQKLDVTDRDATVMWLQDNHEDFIRYREPEISKNDVKALLNAGTAVPGCALVEERSYSLK